MKLFNKHKKRVEKVKDFTAKNKVFAVMMVVAVIFLLFNFVFVSRESPQIIPQNDVSISDNVENEAETAIEPQRETWRFYFIDLIILGAGGGFCLIMILRQRRKTREELK
jgi:Fe2+ transport system protein B